MNRPYKVLIADDEKPVAAGLQAQLESLDYLLKPVTSPSLHAALQVAVARAREIKALRENVSSLEMTLRERKLIERAKGILMARRNLQEADAFRLLQRQSQDRRMPMAKLAESIVQADELLELPHHHP